MIASPVMEFHEVASIFPMMGDEEYKALVDNIRTKGLLEPIWIYQGKIIDGRNRYNACLETGVEPRFREWNGNDSLVEFVVSLNFHRRHLTSSQRAMIALEIEERLAVEAKERQGTRTDLLQIVARSEPIHAASQAASLVGTNHTYVTDAKKIVAQAPELKEAVLNGSLTIPQAKAIVVNRDGVPLAVPHIISKNNEWYTPAKYISAARELMGSIDLDPASCEEANRTVAAANYYDSTQNGLETPWYDRVWLNPPYGYTNGESNQALWSSRLIDQYTIGNVTQAVLLVNAAVDTKWFHRLFQYCEREPHFFPVCFPDHRINFYSPDSSESGSTHGSALVYFGTQIKEFYTIFCQFGLVMERMVYRW